MLYFNINFCSLFNFTAGARIQSIPGEQQLLSLLPVPSMNNHYITVEEETLCDIAIETPIQNGLYKSSVQNQHTKPSHSQDLCKC